MLQSFNSFRGEAVKKQFDTATQTFSPGSCENRLVALENVQSFLESNQVDWRCLYEVFRRACWGSVDFRFNGVLIRLMVDKVFLEGEEKIRLSIDLEKDWFEKTITYGYKLEELEALVDKKQLKTDGFRRGR